MEWLLWDYMCNYVNYYKCFLCDMICLLFFFFCNYMCFCYSEDWFFKCDCCDYSCKNFIDFQKYLDIYSEELVYRCDFENCIFIVCFFCFIKFYYCKVYEGDFELRYKCYVCDKCFIWGNNFIVYFCKKYQFKWFLGYFCFWYKEYEDGYMWLQLVCYESVELIQ